MKIRSGFVSNSSSSSFIIVGFKASRSEIEQLEEALGLVESSEEDRMESYRRYDAFTDEGFRITDSGVVGVVMARVSSDGGEADFCWDLKDFEDAIKKARAKFGKDTEYKVFFVEDYT